MVNNAVFGKTMQNVRKNGDTKLVKTERKRNYSVSKPNYHTAKFFTESLLAIEIKKRKKTELFMDKLVHLDLLILKLSKASKFKYRLTTL